MSTDTRIIEESERPDGARIATVTTHRGEEFIINVDDAICALADLFSDLRNEERGGWSLNEGWYREALGRLRASSTAQEDGAR